LAGFKTGQLSGIPKFGYDVIIAQSTLLSKEFSEL
jgi:hypothetical protein